jgi:hypothetical protein
VPARKPSSDYEPPFNLLAADKQNSFDPNTEPETALLLIKTYILDFTYIQN